MKQEQFETIISLKKVFLFPRTKRIKKALNAIKSFAKKHEKNAEVVISTDVNKFLHSNSKNIPRKINAILAKKGKTVTVYLKESKQLEEDKKKREEKEKGKKGKKEEKKDEKAGQEEKEANDKAEEKKRLEQKREKEKAAKSVEFKTGRK